MESHTQVGPGTSWFKVQQVMEGNLKGQGSSGQNALPPQSQTSKE